LKAISEDSQFSYNQNNVMHLDSGHWNQGVQFWSPNSSY